MPNADDHDPVGLQAVAKHVSTNAKGNEQFAPLSFFVHPFACLGMLAESFCALANFGQHSPGSQGIPFEQKIEQALNVIPGLGKPNKFHPVPVSCRARASSSSRKATISSLETCAPVSRKL